VGLGRFMKPYPSIPHRPDHSGLFHIFDKLDGSLIRAEWTPKRGFAKFGRKNGLLDDSNPWLAEAPGLFHAKYAEELERVFRKKRYKRATAFLEFHGPSSFAGNHEDEEHDVTLFDVAPFKKGILASREFLKLFGHLDHPKVLHHGRVGPWLLEAVREGSLDGVTFEGVVCKGAFSQKAGGPVMFKIKTQAWIDRLKGACGDDEAKFEALY